jgi:hypothetical protein
VIHDKKIIHYELNEVPRRVLDDYALSHPRSSLARMLREGFLYQTVTEDQGILSPWITWPTLHRGISNDKHCISDFGQDLAEVNAEYPSFIDLLSRAGIKVGVFGSLHTYPLPDNVQQYAFFVPDTFANGPECFPESLSTFQDFNLRMMDASGRNVSRSILLGPAARFLAKAPALGLRLETAGRLAGQLISERMNRARVGRRRTSQMQIAFDLFMRQLSTHRPNLATFFTNHVASSMHRYWPAKFPDDYSDSKLDDAWRATYAGEIDFTMREADRQIAALVSFVDRNPEYALVIVSSMGQAAVDSSTVVHHQLYITDLGRFMRALGLGEGDWAKHRAMLPRYIFRISPAQVETFKRSIATLKVNGVPVQVAELGSDVFQIKLGHENLKDEDTVVELQGRAQTPAALGLANVPIQDETGSYAYHIPNGIMLVYNPSEPKGRGAYGGEISTREIAPTMLANFNVRRPGYMAPAIS